MKSPLLGAVSIKIPKYSRKGINGLHPKNKYTTYVQNFEKCRIVTGDHTTIEGALIATAKALGGTKSDFRNIKSIFVEARTIKAFRITPEDAWFERVR